MLKRALLLLAVAAVAAVPAYAALTRQYVGQTNEGGHMQFSISKDGKSVISFRFANRCPADSNKGTLVNGRMRIRSDRTFARHDSQFTITGHFTVGGAKGMARDRTGDCDSGKLTWTATNVRTVG
jgi:hypothetical protein